ncbi:MAG: septum formation initiator family protein [Deltaproteobacteria bacterium]|jgi:cell division protein FtsB|nr:septum formation initiator family protein [Deltaproteobacteria bacterium]
MNATFFKIFSRCIICLASLIGLITIIGNQGLIKLLNINSEFSHLQQQNHEIETQIFDLRNKIYAIKNDQITLERIAREELGLARKNERLYTFK